jgi:exopolysaccharide production protein ExoZ
MFHSTFTVMNFGGRAPFDLALRGGHAGVEYFFVLSGFIIYYAHQRDLSRSSTIPSYARKRATRILPMLWLILVVWGALRIALVGATTRGTSSWSDLLLDMLLLPHGGLMVLGVTWTLQRELVFYFLFATALFDRRLGVIVLAGWQLAVMFATALRLPNGPWTLAVFDVHNLGFGVGLLIGIYGTRMRFTRPLLLAALGALIFIALLVLEWRVGGPPSSDFRPLGRWTSPMLYTAASGICLLGLVLHDQRGTGRTSRLVGTLGGASYVLYLVHPPVLSLLIRAIGRFHLPPELQLFVLVAGSVVVAAALHLWVEKPILRALRPKHGLSGQQAINTGTSKKAWSESSDRHKE